MTSNLLRTMFCNQARLSIMEERCFPCQIRTVRLLP